MVDKHFSLCKKTRWGDIKRYIAMSHSWFSDRWPERYFTEAIYCDDDPHDLRYILLAIYLRNDVSLVREIAGKLPDLGDLSLLRCQEIEWYIGRTKRDKRR